MRAKSGEGVETSPSAIGVGWGNGGLRKMPSADPAPLRFFLLMAVAASCFYGFPLWAQLMYITRERTRWLEVDNPTVFLGKGSNSMKILERLGPGNSGLMLTLQKALGYDLPGWKLFLDGAGQGLSGFS